MIFLLTCSKLHIAWLHATEETLSQFAQLAKWGHRVLPQIGSALGVLYLFFFLTHLWMCAALQFNFWYCAVDWQLCCTKLFVCHLGLETIMMNELNPHVIPLMYTRSKHLHVLARSTIGLCVPCALHLAVNAKVCFITSRHLGFFYAHRPDD